MDREKLLENPTWDAGRECVVCGSPYVQMHHVICGVSNRKVSDRHGYVIPLCYEHHLGGNGIHRNRGMQMYWMELAQQHYELYKGTREDFRREFGKSYL